VKLKPGHIFLYSWSDEVAVFGSNPDEDFEREEGLSLLFNSLIELASSKSY
jgi:hypothetical protein